MAKNEHMVTTVTNRDNYYLYSGEVLTNESIDNLPRKSKVALAVTDKEFISYNFDVSKDLSEEEIAESVEIKMFQEAGLNPMLEYKIVYEFIESKLDAGKLNIQAFAISHNALEKNCKALVKKLGFIDTVIPTTSLPTVLYKKNILEQKSDIFIYFTKDTLYVSVFIDGQLVYGKTIDSGLKKLSDDFVRTTGEQIKYDELISVLIGKGVDENNYSLEDRRYAIDFKDLLTSVSANLNSVLQYVMRLFAVESFDRIFMGTCRGVIPGSNEFIKELMGIETFDYLFYSDQFLKGDNYVDQRDVLLFLELDSIDKEEQQNPLNVTIYNRPSSFFKRTGGQLITAAAASFIIFALIPLFFYGNALYVDNKSEKKLSLLNLNKKEFNEFKIKEQKLSNERKALENKLKNANTRLKAKEELLKQVNIKRDKKSRVTLFLNNVFKVVNDNRVKINQLDYKDKTAIFNLKASGQKYITSLVRDLVGLGYSVEMQSVNFSDGSYTADVEVGLK